MACAHTRTQLKVGERYEIRRDQDNPHDRNAVAVILDGVKVASLKRDSAVFLAKIMDLPAIAKGEYLLKPKRDAKFHSRRFGKTQVCNVGFYIGDCSEELVKRVLRSRDMKRSDGSYSIVLELIRDSEAS